MGVFRLFLALSIGIPLSWNSLAGSEDGSDNMEILNTIEAYRQYAFSLTPIDYRLQSIVTDHFRDDVRPVQTITGRLQYDTELERLRWAVEIVDETTDKPNGQYYAVNISGRMGQRASTPGNIPIIQTYKSFAAAVQDASVPLPESWGIIEYPFGGDPSVELKRIQTIVTAPNTDAKIDQDNGHVRLSAKQVHEKGVRYDTYEWKFSLPDLVPESNLLRRAINGTNVTYYDVELTWQTNNGCLVPLFIFSNSGRLMWSGGKKVLGHREQTTEFEWKVVKDKVIFDESFKVTSVVAIQEFLRGDK